MAGIAGDRPGRARGIARRTIPPKPITLVNPYAAGGPADLLARTVAAGMSDLLGQQIVILNKPGGATAIGAAHVASAAPDGYTLLIAGASSHIVTPAMSKVTYDGIKDFALVAMVANVPNVLVVRPSLPVKSVPELIALAKSNPGSAQLRLGRQRQPAASRGRDVQADGRRRT